MKTGFKFKGIHTSKMGVSASTAARPIIPAMKRVTYEADCGDGAIDLSSANELGRPLYSERAFGVNLLISADNIFELQNRLAEISLWLCGSGELEFDDCPGIIWDATVAGEIGYIPERGGRRAVLRTDFTVKPFSRATFSSETGPILGDGGILLGYGIPIGLPQSLVFEKTADNDTFTVCNIGTAHTKPKITIEGENGESETYYCTVSLNGRKISFDAITDGITIVDMENGKMTCGGRAAVPSDGVMLELAPGENEMKLDVFDGAQVMVSYTPRFVYCWEVAE